MNYVFQPFPLKIEFGRWGQFARVGGSKTRKLVYAIDDCATIRINRRGYIFCDFGVLSFCLPSEVAALYSSCGS